MDGCGELRREAEEAETRLEEVRVGLARVEVEITALAREAAKSGGARARFAALNEQKRLKRIAAAGGEVLEIRRSVGSPLTYLPGRFAGGELHQHVSRLLYAYLGALRAIKVTAGEHFEHFELDRWRAAAFAGQDAVPVPEPRSPAEEKTRSVEDELRQPAEEEAAA